MFLAVAMTTGCKFRHPLIGMHCEGGVKNERESMGGDCIDITAEKRDGHPDTVGSALIVSAYQFKFDLRRTPEVGKYELRYEGRSMGTLEHSDSNRWLTVTFSDVPKGASLSTGRKMSFRDDAPSIMQ